MKATLSFYGGVGAVTGANFLLAGERTKILIDCGLVQGEKFALETNRQPFAYEPSSIDFLLVTHAHIDHIGRIPKLVRDGFKGVIYSTPQTLDLSRLMLPDALRVLQAEVPEGEAPFYDEQDIQKAFSLWKTVPLHESFVAGEFDVTTKDSGHVLGSVMFEIRRTGGEKAIVFTGDLGNSPTPLLKEAEAVTGAAYMVMESVYGNRNHVMGEQRKERLAEVIRASVERGGVLLIPCFSLEKTQVLLYEMDDLLEEGKIPKVPVFLDAPLAIKVTEVYRKYGSDFNDAVKRQLSAGDDIFRFPNLHVTADARDTASIISTPSPKIIIAGSGMSAGGRILEHERRYLGDPQNTILFIGYQAIGGLGRQIQDGVKHLTINHHDVKVKARIETISGYSSHMDSQHLVEFASKGADSFEKIFVVMGEPKAAHFLSQRIQDYLTVSTHVPELGESVEIEL